MIRGRAQGEQTAGNSIQGGAIMQGMTRRARTVWQGAAFLLAGALVAGPLVAVGSSAAAVDSEIAAPELGVDVKGADAAGSKADPIKPAANPEIPDVTWPESGSATVPVVDADADEKRTSVGSLPVTIAQAEDTSVDEVVVQVEPQAAENSAGVNRSLLLGLSTADGIRSTLGQRVAGAAVTKPSVVDVEIDYSQFAGAFGGSYDDRLTLVQVPGCALTAPEKAECLRTTPVAATNETATDTLVARDIAVPGDGSATVLMVTADVSSDSGNFGASPLSPSNTWSTDLRSGAFSWSYPINTPDVPGSLVPSLGLSYSSGGIDGRTGGTNNQASLVGDGFDLWPGYIERKYKSCALDDVKNDAGNPIGDLCWDYDNAFISFNGAAGELVPAGTDTWRLSTDDGTKIKRLKDTARSNGDADGEYWEVTTPNGTKYYFGYQRLPGWETGDPVTNSAWTAPVVGDNTGDPCNTNAGKWCTQAWRWNLDYAIDAAGNVITYHYTKETNYYGRLGNPASATGYTRGGTLARIDYGLRGDDLVGAGAAQPLGRVAFTYGQRCLTDTPGGAQCTDINTQPSGWYDTPWDLNCVSGSTCDQGRTSPSFWTRNRMTGIATSVFVDAAWKSVDSWALTHKWGTADTDYQLELAAITRTGNTGPEGAASISLPAVRFEYAQRPNRLDKTGDGQAPFIKERLATIVDETGGQVDVKYSAPACVEGSLPSANDNTTRCFPQVRSMGEVLPAVTDWFNKYVVESVTTTDRTGGEHSAPDAVTSYEYLDGAAWHWDESTGMVPDEEKTWSDWRGYGHVRVTTGAPNEPKSQSEQWFLRGMNGDRSNREGTATKSVSVTLGSGEGDPITDSAQHAGFSYKSATFSGPGGKVLSKTVNRPWWYQTAVSQREWGTIRAGFSRAASTKTWTSLDNGAGSSWRTTEQSNTYDQVAGRVTQLSDKGNTATTADDRCVTTDYATNTTKNILGLHARQQTWAVGCAVTPNRAAGDVISDVRYAYDGGDYATAPTIGRPTRVADLAGYNGTTAKRIETGTTYDTYGRVLTVTEVAADVLETSAGALTRTARSEASTTTTTYTPATGFATTMTEKTPPATAGTASSALSTTTTLDPVRGVPTIVKDANDYSTKVAYDALGRTSKIWLADRVSTQTPSTEFTYRITEGLPVRVGTATLNDDGDVRTSYTFYDGLLRPIQTQEPGVSGGTILTDTFYDGRGLVHTAYNPYYSTSANPGTLFDAWSESVVDSQVRTEYDGLGRPTQSKLMVGDDDGQPVLSTTRTIYGGDRTTVIPAVGATPTTTLTDARGQSTELRQHHSRTNVDPNATTGFDRTRYTYTGRGELKTVVDPAGNTWSYTFDQRGRQTAASDPDAGTTTSTYDDFGQLRTTTNAENETLAYSYDGLGRKTELREGSSTGTLRASWTYDTVTGGKGQLAKTTRFEAGGSYVTQVAGYDRLYRPTRTAVTIPSSEGKLQGTYLTTTSYAVDGSVQAMGMPAAGSLPGQTVGFEADPDTGWVTATTGPNGLRADATYDYVGKLTQLDMVAGVSGSLHAVNTYERGTGRLIEYQADRLMQPGIDRSETYTYDEAGNVLSLADVSRTGTDVQCFDYDYLARMVDAWTQGSGECAATGQAASDAGAVGGVAPYWHEYTYDLVGSRQTEVQNSIGGGESVTRTYGYSATQPHTTTTVNQTTTAPGSNVDSVENYTYDAVGRTTSRQIGGDTQNLTWSPESRVESVENADASGAEYVYDADGNRLLARNTSADGSTSTTLYLGHTEITVTSAEPTIAKATRYVDLGGGHMAIIDDTGAVTFNLADHHGTGQLSVKASDMSITQRRTTPFGEVRGTAPTEWAGSRGFVGGYDDTETTGLVSLGAREYDPALGRFISLDPVMDLSDPQQVHGYSYANNNPATLSDPTGLCPSGSPMLEGAYCDFGDGWSQVGPVNTGYEGGGADSFTPGDSPGEGPVPPRVNDPGDPTDGPTEDEQARAQRILNSSVTAVAMELGWEALKEFIGWNDLMGCLGADVLSCASLAIGILPVGKGLKAVKALYKVIDGAIDFYKTVKWARGIMSRVGTKAKQIIGGAPQTCSIGNSFAPGTLVLLADGSKKPIEEIELGDKVLAADEETGNAVGPRDVTALISGDGAKNLVTISISGSGGQISELVATDGHPFWIPAESAWVDAVDLRSGDWLRTSAGARVQVTSVAVSRQYEVVYNLTIRGDHTYYVLAGEASALVHNGNCGGVGGALKGWRTHYFQMGSQQLRLTKERMQHILERHHPSYRKGADKEDQTNFKRNVSIQDVEDAISSVTQQNRGLISSRGIYETYQVQGVYRGYSYTMGITNGKIGQFYPNY
ncbi:polymorphic toxin-type HINT domain-containing protein [Promicromonospora sp. NPDC059942]|uniref:polymorphic toxin-type HINT domain-containing protein n=1 Tax=Promicromonospora sp. NPDC059942 TaxID=3347009 RepID=UPI0036651B72